MSGEKSQQQPLEAALAACHTRDESFDTTS